MDMNIQYLQGVGPRRAALLKSELEIETVRDLLSQYPFRYIDRTSFHRIADIVPDQAYIQIKAAVKSVKLLGKKGDTLDPSSAPKGAVNRLSAIVEDDSGSTLSTRKSMIPTCQRKAVFPESMPARKS